MNVYVFFNTSWDISHPTRSFNWLETFQNNFRMFRHCVTIAPVWIFAACGQLLVIYTEDIITNLKLLTTVTMKGSYQDLAQQTFAVLRPLKQIYSATYWVQRYFSTMLLANCYLVVNFMLTSSYYVIEYIGRRLILVACWDACFVIEGFIRFWFICHVADRMRQTVSCMILFCNY